MSHEDTAADDRGASRRQITERKVKADGSVREFACEALLLTRSLAVIRYVVSNPSQLAAPIAIDPGSLSDGWFWARRPYSLYRFRRADGSVAGHRFDAVAGVRLAPEAIEYRDLVLDWWVLPDGRIVEEDRDELAALEAAGVVDGGFAADANRAAAAVLGRYRHILEEVERLEARLGIWP